MRALAPLLAFALCGLAPAGASAQDAAHQVGRSVKPGQLFAGRLLNVHAPESFGWIFTGYVNNGLGFARKGAAQDESYGAQAVLFDLPPTSSSEDLVAVVRNRVESANPPPRFAALESDYAFSDRRGYPCVRFRGSFDDREALTAAGTRTTMNMQVVALYCRHPSVPNAGFFAAYSHRGAGKVADLEARAQQFIEGVQVPPQGDRQ